MPTPSLNQAKKPDRQDVFFTESIAYFVVSTLLAMVKNCLYFGLLLGLSACEPFDLAKKNFIVCAKPSADVGYTSSQLGVTLFLDNPQGDIDVVGWDAGDGSGKSRAGDRVTYFYDQPGTYTVTLTIANSCDDRFTKTQQITVTN